MFHLARTLLGVCVISLIWAEGACAGVEPWRKQMVRSGGVSVMIRHHARDRAELARVAGLVAHTTRRFEAIADTHLTVPMQVILASTNREFRELTRGFLPEWSAACAIPDRRMLIVVARTHGKPLDETVIHETSHVLLHTLAGRPIPRWFDEGISMYLSREWGLGDSFRLARGMIAGGMVPLAGIDSVFSFHREHAWLAYSESFAAVSWLAETFGESGLAIVIRSLANHGFDDAMMRGTGLHAHEFETLWIEKAGVRYALTGLADDMWLWTYLIPALFFAALVARWWRNKQTMKRWKQYDEEDWDDGPDEPLDERIAETY
jgi:hypothetical protein